MLIAKIFLYIFLSIAIGLFMGIIGGGGGGIYVVILMIILHQNAKIAAMTALALSTITLSGAALQYFRKQQYNLKYFISLSILDIIGTLLGAAVMNYINENILKFIILIILLLSGMSTFIKIKSSNMDNTEIAALAEKLPKIIPVGLISGLITGTTGLSASTMLSSLLISLFDFPPYLAVGTTTLVSFAGNLMSIIMLYLSSFIFQYSIIHIDVETLLIFGIGSAIGAMFGAKLTSRINRKVLAVVLGAMAIIPCIYLAIKK